MALIQVPSSNAPRTIALLPNGTSVFYTVPAGKTFVGYAIPMSNLGVYINSTYVASSASGSSSSANAIPLTLTSGTTVSSHSSYTNWSLVGVEQ